MSSSRSVPAVLYPLSVAVITQHIPLQTCVTQPNPEPHRLCKVLLFDPQRAGHHGKIGLLKAKKKLILNKQYSYSKAGCLLFALLEMPM